MRLKMFSRMNKFLILSIIICNHQLVNASDNYNRINEVNNNIVQEKSYSIPININTPLEKEEIEIFFDNLNNSPNALVNTKYQLYSIECKYFEQPVLDAIRELLYEYFQEVSKSKNSNLYNFYVEKLSRFPDDYGIQIVHLINQYLNNPISIVKENNSIEFDKNTINDAYEICNNIIAKIIRGVNLTENLIKAKKNIIKSIKSKGKIHENNANILTLSNQNGKCWFMSYFSFLISMYDNSDIDDPIRKTNFSKFVNFLHNKQSHFRRKFYIDDDYNLKQNSNPKYNEWNYFDKGRWEAHMTYNGYNEYLYPSSNIIGERIDLISEIILWCSQNKNMYNIVNNKKNINDITLEEDSRRNKALNLLENQQDLFYGARYSSSSALMIILNIFPELKEFIGNGPAKGWYLEDDAMIVCAETTALTDNELKEESIDLINSDLKYFEQNINRKIEQKNMIENIQSKIGKDSQKYKTLQEEKEKLENEIEKYNSNIKFYKRKLNKINNTSNKKEIFDKMNLSSFNYFASYWNEGHANVLMNINNGTVFSNKQYLLFETEFDNKDTDISDLINGYRYITHYNTNGELELYELSGMLLNNIGHVICFVKTSKSDFSWSGIDSSLYYNDDGYTLDDIIYNDTLVEKNSNGKILKDKNTYLAKLYRAKHIKAKYQDNKKYHPIAVLYRKITKDEVMNPIKHNLLVKFDNISYNVITEEYKDNNNDIIDSFNSEDNDNKLIELCKKIILNKIGKTGIYAQIRREIYELLNNKNYNYEVNDIIHNNIYSIVSKYYEDLYKNTKIDDINFDINDITIDIPQKAKYYHKENPNLWLDILKCNVKRNYLIKNIKNRYRNNYINSKLIGSLDDNIREYMLRNNKFEYCILSSINTLTNKEYFDFRKEYNSKTFSIIKREFEEMNPSWNMENISRLCNLIRNGYITNPDIIKYMMKWKNTLYYCL